VETEGRTQKTQSLIRVGVSSQITGGRDWRTKGQSVQKEHTYYIANAVSLTSHSKQGGRNGKWKTG